MRWQRRRDVLLAFYREHRILFAVEDERRTVNAGQRWEENEGATFTPGRANHRLTSGRRIVRCAARGSVRVRV